jgi:hypothetical protein
VTLRKEYCRQRFPKGSCRLTSALCGELEVENGVVSRGRHTFKSPITLESFTSRVRMAYGTNAYTSGLLKTTLHTQSAAVWHCLLSVITSWIKAVKVSTVNILHTSLARTGESHDRVPMAAGVSVARNSVPRRDV